MMISQGSTGAFSESAYECGCSALRLNLTVRAESGRADEEAHWAPLDDCFIIRIAMNSSEKTEDQKQVDELAG